MVDTDIQRYYIRYMSGNERKWEVFGEVGARRCLGGARVTIRQEGGIYFDEVTYRELGEPQAVLLMWEERTRTIGVQAASLDAQNAVVVRRSTQRSTERVARSMPFMRKHGVDVTRSMRLPFAYVEDGVLVLELKTAVVVSSRRWKQKLAADERRANHDLIEEEKAKIREERLRAAEQVKAEREKLKLERGKAREKEREFEARTREIAKIKRRYQAIHN
ncbi:MAG TPA: hypothetical protein VGI80_07145 [Pyrinomonadaceae bacterium]|jgi:hypothetical protein